MKRGSGSFRFRGAGNSLPALRRLDRVKSTYGPEVSHEKLALLRVLGARSLPGAGAVLRLHDLLCFLRAYPDDADVLARVERMLDGFHLRADLRRHREALADSGIAGTPIDFRFFAPTASWLARRWGDRMDLDWKTFRHQDLLARILPLLTLDAEIPALDEYDLTPGEWIRTLKGPKETDAAFLIRRFDALPLSSLAREKLYDELDPPVRLSSSPETPSRTRAKLCGARIAFQTRPLSRERPSLHHEILRPPLRIREAPRALARKLIDLARSSMVTRSRDLDVFSWADERDVRLVDCGDGLQFACFGAIPERRLLLESVCGFLTLKNGVPTGYVLASALFESSEVAYNVFETYRGAESALVYGRVLSMIHTLFGSTAFSIDPYQVGRGNEEAIRSGAWWFYQKLGFRPSEPAARRLMQQELRRIQNDSQHRSSPAVLRRLAQSPLHLFLGKERSDVLGIFSAADVGLAVIRSIADRYGSNREHAERDALSRAAGLLPIRSARSLSPGERLAWRRWSPLIAVLPGVDRWSAGDKRRLIDVVRAKGSAREGDFVRIFDAHRPLRRAILGLASKGQDA